MSEKTQTNIEIYTICMVQDGDKVLLINRPDKLGFPGFIAPGGKIDFPETASEGAIREVREETGLRVKDIVYKGLYEYVIPEKNFRYMVFNYLATSFEGELLLNPPEGELVWVTIKKALNLPMQPWFKKRFPLFFEPTTFEHQLTRDVENKRVLGEKLRLFGTQTQQ